MMVMMTGNIRSVIVALLVLGATQIYGDSQIKGRLLTPQEGCGLTKVRNARIIGGSDAPVGAWPWMALLGYTSKDNSTIFDCGGTLITSRHVLTAAHCIYEFLSILTLVRLGEHDLTITSDGPHQDIPIICSVIHPHFPINKLNDIAMLHLKYDVEFSDRIRPICLPLDEPLRSLEFIGKNPFVAGWGRLNKLQERASVLQQLQVPVVDTQICRYLYRQILYNLGFVIDHHVICAGGFSGNGAFYADSGGPLMLPIYQNGTFSFYEIGIVSFSAIRNNLPTVYSSVQYHADWIKEQL